jgi:hypothetical protein
MTQFLRGLHALSVSGGFLNNRDPSATAAVAARRLGSGFRRSLHNDGGSAAGSLHNDGGSVAARRLGSGFRRSTCSGKYMVANGPAVNSCGLRDNSSLLTLTRGSLKGLTTGEKREESSEFLTETSASYMISQRLLVLLVIVKLQEDVLAKFELY